MSAECCGEKPDVKSSFGLNPLQNTTAEKNGANINGTAKPVPKKKKSNDEFRRKYFGEDEKTAKKIVEQAEKERK